jgi:hypothetical protein
MNLKLILMELGNRLVTEYGANPQEDPRCVAIQQMMEMLNDSFEARLILEDLSVDWPVVEKKALAEAVEFLSMTEGMRYGEKEDSQCS